MYRDLAAATSPEAAEKIKEDINKRENLLMPVYTQVAHVYADLHDRAPRMAARGGVRKILTWEKAREFFYWRVRRRLAANNVVKKLMAADPSLSWEEALSLLHKENPQTADAVDDQEAVAFLESSEGREKVGALLRRTEAAASRRELLQLVGRLSAGEKRDVLSEVQALLSQQ